MWPRFGGFGLYLHKFSEGMDHLRVGSYAKGFCSNWKIGLGNLGLLFCWKSSAMRAAFGEYFLEKGTLKKVEG